MDWDSYFARLPILSRVVRRLPDGVVVEESVSEVRQTFRNEQAGATTDYVAWVDTMAQRVDTIQPEIVEGLRRLGWGVWDTHTVGRGSPDLVVCSPDGRLALGEVKTPGGRLTPRERYWHSIWPGTVHIWRSLADVLATFGLTVEERA